MWIRVYTLPVTVAILVYSLNWTEFKQITLTFLAKKKEKQNPRVNVTQDDRFGRYPWATIEHLHEANYCDSFDWVYCWLHC